VKKAAGAKSVAGAKPAQQRAKAPTNKAYSVAGDSPSGGQQGGSGAYAIMASRIANRVAEMAESITFVERYGLIARSESKYSYTDDVTPDLSKANSNSSSRSQSRRRHRASWK